MATYDDIKDWTYGTVLSVNEGKKEITLNAGEGKLFSTPVHGYYIEVWPAGTLPLLYPSSLEGSKQVEAFRIEAGGLTVDTFTWTSREQLGTPPRSIQVGDQVCAPLSAESIKAIQEATAEALLIKNNLSDVETPGLARSNLKIPDYTPAHAVATSPITLSGSKVVDGITLVESNLCLVTGQTNKIENGEYEVKSAAWVRTKEMFTGAELKSGRVGTVMKGNNFGRTTWQLNYTNTPIIVGTSEQEWFSMTHFASPQPAEVAILEASNAETPISIQGGAGGNTSRATEGKGGAGGSIEPKPGKGGVAPNAATKSEGGAGGGFRFVGAEGGEGGSGLVSKVAGAGNGGGVEITGGKGGLAESTTGKASGGGGGGVQVNCGEGGRGSCLTAGNTSANGGPGGTGVFKGGTGGEAAGATEGGKCGEGGGFRFTGGRGGESTLTGSVPGNGGGLTFTTGAGGIEHGPAEAGIVRFFIGAVAEELPEAALYMDASSITHIKQLIVSGELAAEGIVTLPAESIKPGFVLRPTKPTIKKEEGKTFPGSQGVARTITVGLYAKAEVTIKGVEHGLESEDLAVTATRLTGGKWESFGIKKWKATSGSTIEVEFSEAPAAKAEIRIKVTA